MINIGGFGHSGNTALVDFFSDSPDICPIGYHFTESAIIRSKWGFRAILSNFENDASFTEWNYIQDCLLGTARPEHQNLSPPVIHDFTRNARVKGYLGEDYEHETKYFIKKLMQAHSENYRNSHVALSLSKSFLDKISDLAIKKSGRDSAIPLMRNDPAAANIDLLKLSTVTSHFTIIRDPGDMMYDWITYYKHSNDIVGAKLFSKQFCKKIDAFIKMYTQLPPQLKLVVKVLKFEHLVKSHNLQNKLYNLINIEKPMTSLRFQPKLSEENIGINQYLSSDGKREADEVCVPAVHRLLSFLPSNTIID